MTIVCNLSWQSCSQVPSQVYGSIIQGKMSNSDDKAAIGEIVYAAQAIVDNAAQKVGGRGRHGRPARRCSGTVPACPPTDASTD